MPVRSLGYLVLGVSDVAAWLRFSRDVLGVEVNEDEAGGLLLRLDEYAWRIAIEHSPIDDILAAGWELSGPEALDALVATLKGAGVTVALDPELAAKRKVKALARFVDPAGICGELYWGPTVQFEKPIVSPKGISGFVLGEEGLGHIVVAAQDLEGMQSFYANLLGFRLSDYIDIPGGPHGVIPVTFMHCNSRHHTLAFAPGPPTKKLLHFMLQTQKLDDVGFALDRVVKGAAPLALTLGRHSNDHMVSFYASTPSGFEVEYGWGARSIDDNTWTPVRHDRMSAWGHIPVGDGGPPRD